MNIIIMLGSFMVMEGVSYATHRWLMHGAGMCWHRSHHAPQEPGWEANDLFPACFSVIGFALFALSAFGPRIHVLLWSGIGVTAYGMGYLFVHEVYIHERLPVRVPRTRYLQWLRESHRIHHLFGGEPYGMLLPLVPRSLRRRAASSTTPSAEPVALRPLRRESTRAIRNRL